MLTPMRITITPITIMITSMGMPTATIMTMTMDMTTTIIMIMTTGMITTMATATKSAARRADR
jgi:hypothetical protein